MRECVEECVCVCVCAIACEMAGLIGARRAMMCCAKVPIIVVVIVIATSSKTVSQLLREKTLDDMPSEAFVRRVGYLGAAANWLIPIAAISNLVNMPVENINPQLTGVLAVYSCVFMRWALAISPANYPLFACHVANSTAQTATLVKYALGSGSKTQK